MFVMTKPFSPVSDSKKWPDKQCEFPAWLEKSVFYRTVNGSHKLEFTSDTRVKVLKLSDATGQYQIVFDVQCVEQVTNNVTGGLFVAKSFIIQDW